MALAPDAGHTARDILPEGRSGDRFADACRSRALGDRLRDAAAPSNRVADTGSHGYRDAYRDGARAYCNGYADLHAVRSALTDGNRHAVADADLHANPVALADGNRHADADSNPPANTVAISLSYPIPGLHSDSNPVADADKGACQQPGSGVAGGVGGRPSRLERIGVAA